MTMSIENVPTTEFTPGTTGIWLGLGFKGLLMTHQDMVSCYVTFSGTAADDSFNCEDRYTEDTKIEPTKDSIQNVVKVFESIKYQNGKAAVSVTFRKPFESSNDATQDEILEYGYQSFVWATGLS